MIYRNNRPYPISLLNESTGATYVIQPNGLTPDLPESLAAFYEGTLIPLYTSPVSKSVQTKMVDNELFETEEFSDGLFEVESEDNKVEEVKILNEVKRGRGRPKKI